jgi:hypothetical protein
MPKYTTHYVMSWYRYQSITPSHLHSIEHYNKTCEEDAKLYGDNVMVVRENVEKITGYYWYGNGCPHRKKIFSRGIVHDRHFVGIFYRSKSISMLFFIKKSLGEIYK